MKNALRRVELYPLFIFHSSFFISSPSFPSDHGLLSVPAYPPFRIRLPFTPSATALRRPGNPPPGNAPVAHLSPAEVPKKPPLTRLFLYFFNNIRKKSVKTSNFSNLLLYLLIIAVGKRPDSRQAPSGQGHFAPERRTLGGYLPKEQSNPQQNGKN